jgi:YfiH family protein
MSLATATTQTESPVADAIPRMELEAWREAGFRAGITSRQGGFDLGLFANGPASHVLGNWLAFQASQQAAFPSIAVARQVHGTRIQSHDESREGWRVSDGFDGHLASRSGLLLGVTVADCVPVYLAHPETGTAALLHAGWRGIAAGILEAGLGNLTRRAHCAAADVRMHCGVGICGDCYEVDAEVFRQVTGRANPARGNLDLRAVLLERAARQGVRERSVSPWCSSHHGDLFFSHRRSGGKDGRMLAYLGYIGPG